MIIFWKGLWAIYPEFYRIHSLLQSNKKRGWVGVGESKLVFFQPRKTLEVNLGAIFRDRWRNSGGRSPSKYAGDWHERGPRKALLHMWVSGLRSPTSNGMNTLTGASGFRVGMYWYFFHLGKRLQQKDYFWSLEEVFASQSSATGANWQTANMILTECSMPGGHSSHNWFYLVKWWFQLGCSTSPVFCM